MLGAVSGLSFADCEMLPAGWPMVLRHSEKWVWSPCSLRDLSQKQNWNRVKSSYDNRSSACGAA